MSFSELIKTKQTELQTLVNQAKAQFAAIEALGDKASQEDRNKLATLIEDGKTKRAQIELMSTLSANEDAASSGETVSRKTADNVEGPRRKSAGQEVIDSPQFKSNNRRSMEPVGVKALISGLSSGAGGANVRAERLPDIVEIARHRPASILNFVNTAETSSSSVEYVEFSTRTNTAAETAEAGTKPEGALTFNVRTAAVKTIPVFIPVTRQILEDAPRLRDLIDNELAYMLRERLETQIVSGDGSGSNLTGMLNAAGIQSRVHATSGARWNAGDKIADSLRRAITDLSLEFYDADLIIAHPAQAEALEIAKDTSGQYIKVFDPVGLRVWRRSVVETTAIPEGTALVMQANMAATLWNRTQTEIRIGEPNDYFLKNQLAILAEFRAAFAVTRPKAIEKITGL